MGKLTIDIQTLICPEAYEELEDALRDTLERFGVKAVIEDSETGNTTTTRN